MTRYDYLIVGGGMTADAAVRGIRALDEDGSVALVSEEPDPPYDRPPLSKGLWKEMDEERIWRDTAAEGCELLLDRRVVALDPEARTVSDREGREIEYGELLLATGGEPRTLPRAADGVNYFRTFQDYLSLRDGFDGVERFAVVGGGFIGSEIAAALAMNGKEVTVLFPEEGLCRSVLPPTLSQRLNDYFRERGVDVRPGTLVEAVEGRGEEGYQLSLEDGGGVEAQRVVAGLGIRPRIELARDAGLEVDDGIVTDEAFRTDHEHIWAAGDVARFPSRVLGRALRVEHEDHANSSGMRAGQGMASQPTEYDYLPFFYSDLFDLSYEGVGIVDPALETVEAWDEGDERGTVYYLEEERVRGVLLWNRRGKVREARKLLREEGPFEPEELRHRI